MEFILEINKEVTMRARVDQLKCETIGICVKKCPQVFRFEPGSKKATVIVDEIPPGLEKKCREVANMCPSRAIIIEE
ncbi:MAG: ferredoxin [Deltaproteobacteria bacterium]|nr:ferredoxin [Deltaproteobacteria bacterium]